MAILKVIEYPNPVLSQKASPIEKVSEKELRLIQDMVDTMYAEDGVGIAAPQVGVSKRIIIISPNARRGEERALINPEIIEQSQEELTDFEGCLSLPGVSCEVRRPKKVKFRSWDTNGKEQLEELEHFPARVLQHELDHLNGILMIDRVNFNRRQTLLGSYRKL